MFKRIIAVLSAAMLLAACAGCGGSSSSSGASSATSSGASASAAPASGGGDAMVIKFGHCVDETSHWHNGLLKFKELVEDRTDGRYVIDIYANAQLGGERDEIENVLMGAQDGGVFAATVVSNTVPFLGAFDLPYIIKDQDHVERILLGDLSQKMQETIDGYNFKCLSIWAGGFRCLSNNTRPIQSADDFKGLKVRTQEGSVHKAVWTALGADPVSMSWSDAYTSVQQGAVDGIEVNLSLTKSLNVYEVCKYLAISNEQYTLAPMLMSMNTWNKLPAEDQEILLQCAKEATEYEVGVAKQLDVDALSFLEEKMEVTRPDLGELQAICQPVWSEFPDLAEWVDLINAA